MARLSEGLLYLCLYLVNAYLLQTDREAGGEQTSEPSLRVSRGGWAIEVQNGQPSSWSSHERLEGRLGTKNAPIGEIGRCGRSKHAALVRLFVFLL